MSEVDLVDGTIAAVIVATIIISAAGFRDSTFSGSYIFHVDRILVDREYYRMISSGFLHADWGHLAMNMLTLFFFADLVGYSLGVLHFLLVYFGSMLLGSALALYIHRSHGDYSAHGASGAVFGVIFSAVVLVPEGSISFFLLPLHIKAWIYGVLMIAATIYGVKTKWGNIGHEAHLGGAIAGILLTYAIEPAAFTSHIWVALALLLPVSLFLYFLVSRPEMLLIDNYTAYRLRSYRAEKQRVRAISETQELDELLDKVHHKGMDSLSPRERKRLDTLSKKL